MYVVSKDGKLCPTGVPGELYIGGAGVASGYLNNKELTASKFINNIFSADHPTKLYRTGDLVKYLPDGNILFLGRVDDQVKIRGYRVEPGEISRILSQCELVNQGVVIARADNSGNKRLLAYVIPEGDFEKEAILDFLRSRLPEYMIPAVVIPLQQFPLMANGKIDRKALPEPEAAVTTQTGGEPETELEKTLAAIWASLLEVDQVQLQDDFFALGGHSLLAIRVISAIRKQLGVVVSIGDLFDYPTVGALAAQIAARSAPSPVESNLVRRERPAHIPLSYSQERLWFIDQLEGSVHYHIPTVIRLRGNLDKVALENAFRTIVNRHEALRTVVVTDNGDAGQRILDKDGWQLQVTDDPALKQDTVALQAYIQQLLEAPFDLTASYMLRAHLVVLGATEYILVAVVHHIASDAWSKSIIVKELAALYNAATVELPVPEMQYADYALWQRGYLDGAVLEEKISYWKNKLTGVAALNLPTDFPRPVVQSTRGAVVAFNIDKTTTDGLNTLSREEGVTLFMTLLAAYNVLLYRYSGGTDICIGTSIAGRTRQELEGIVGFFINTLALRTDLSNDPAFTALLQQVKQTTLEAFGHQDVPFEKVVEAVVKQRDVSRTPLFQAAFSLQSGPVAPDLALNGLVLENESVTYTTTKFDLVFTIQETPEGLHGLIEYGADLFREDTIHRMAAHYGQLLRAVVQSRKQKVNALTMLTPDEMEQLLTTFNDTAVPFPQQHSILDLFALQVITQPDATALIYNDEIRTYKELDDRSNQLAHFLQHRGVTKETLVPLCMHRSFEMLTAIFAVLKAGGAYVPVDPDYPEQRISYMLADTGATLLLSASSCEDRLPVMSGIDIILLDNEQDNINAYAKTPLQEQPSPDQLAYVIYTSGSTGRPKGVMIEHQGVVNMALGQAAALRLQRGTRSLQFASFGFDASCYEIFNTLLSGGILVLPQQDDLLITARFAALLEKHAVELVTLPPSYQHVVKEQLASVKTVVSAGEPLNREDGQYIRSKGIRLINAYGPTENTVCTTLTDQPFHDNNTIVIGSPVANMQVYILGDGHALCPVGVPGEICTSGAGLARGYLHRPDLTAEKFIRHPYSNAWGSRLYRTGDLGRWLPDGTIEYLGRIDDQVKIRGYRIELGEIERVLQDSDLVKQAVVLAKTDAHDAALKRLVAYVVPDGDFNRTGIISHLQKILPEYMIPAAFVAMEQLPLTPSGKFDRKALPDPEVAAESEYTAPRTATEQLLAGIWEQLLNRERIGIYDNFFEAGGHSLLAMRFMAALRRQLGVELSMKALFLHPTIAGFAAYMQENKVSALPPVVTGERPEMIPLSYSQERLWFIDQLEGSVHYHIPAVLRLKGAIDILSLEKALTAIVGRHEVLRTVFEEYEGEVYQHVQEKGSWQLEVIAVHAVEVDEMITSLINRPFDLAIDHMLRAQLLLLTNNEHLLVVTLHHIAADGWSMGIIVKELAALYQAAIAGNEDPLPVPEIQFADYAVWERTHLSGAVLEEKVAYWRNKLAGTTVLNIPADLPRPAIQSTRGAISLFRFEATLLQQLRYLSQQEGTTLFMTLLAAFKVLLYRYTGQEDVCIGTTIAGRTRQETESLIGFFVNTLALRSDLAGEPSFTALLQQVKETTLNAYDHQEVPFEKVVEEVVKDRDVSRTPLFQVMFELQNTPDTPELELGGLELKQEETGATTAKFDLDFALQESIEGLHLTVSYCTDLFNAETISRMTNHFHQLLESIVGNPAQLISRLKMVTPAEEEELLYLFNNKSVAWPQQETLVSLLTTQAAATPDAIAVKAGSIQLTYGELDAYAGRLAQLLRNNGITTGSMVPICMERSPFMVIAMLGVMKAGAAYVPVDPEYPQERMLFMLDDCAATIAVGTHYGSTKLAAAKNIQVINLEELPESITADNPLLSPDPAHLAYIIYTSGSTGKPKGVMVEHAGMLNHLYAKINDLQLDQHSVIAFTAAYTFDISVWQVFAALLCGGTTVIYDEETILNPAALTEAVDKDRITILELVPSYLAAVLQENITVAWQPLRYLLVTGEAVSWHLLSQWFAHPQFGRVPVVNAYGPTEASDDICHHIMYNLPAYTNIPLGAPVQNLHIYIINKEGQLCPVNVPGEICVSGVGVSRGYLNRPDLTARQFVTDPFVPARGRMYKTGDLGRWLPDGTVEYLGRIDEQVKIRGYRIELGEIESVMLQSGYVKEAVVVAHEDANHNKRLIGYIVPVSSFDKSIILNWLKDKLPEYMIPSLLVELEKVPLTPNGKTDRKALPDPGESLSQLQEYVAPRNETEETLVKIWSGLLGIERIGVTDNFFELGGHSLQVMRLIAMIRKQLQATISVRDFFTLATIESLAKYIRVNQTAPVIPDDDLQTIKL
ncbi:MAG TPA: amino acid adenylation domain-containing protein [Chitinophaga sp.]|uniref:non-ribosomal peptide synthetase n=1 Tax=Chitinophaga sp. TaxID=1869181 RepID=UPI002C925E47|nr:non-ribosomal peptide synthetase [Chitinophaga sp.]HVI44817.1 amino acid adenylation domain-containing protein [Chitinophaga sp.]